MKKLIMKHPVLNISLIVIFVLQNLLFNRGLFSSDSFFGADGIHQISSYIMMLIIFILIPLSVHAFLIEYEKPLLKRILSLFTPFAIYIFLQTIVFVFFAIISKPFELHPILLVGVGLLEIFAVFIFSVFCSVLYCLSNTPLWYFCGILSFIFSPWLIGYGIERCCEVNSLLDHLNIRAEYFNPFLFALSKGSIAAVIVFVAVCIALMLIYKKYSHKIKLSPLYTIYKAITVLLISMSVGFLPLFSIEKTPRNYIIVYALITYTILIVLMLFVFKKYKATLITVGVTVVAFVLTAAIIFIPPMFKDKMNTLPAPDEIEKVEIKFDSLEECVVTDNFDECLDLHKTIIDIYDKEFKAGEDGGTDYVTNVWDGVTFWYTLKNGKTFVREYSKLKDTAFDVIFIDYLKSDMYRESLQNIKNSDSYRIIYNGQYCVGNKTEVADIISTYCDELSQAENTDFYDSYTTLSIESAYELPRDIYIPVTFTNTRDKIDRLIYLNSY